MPETTASESRPADSDVKIVFTPSGRQGRVPHGTSVLAAARQLGVDIDSVCGGRAMCGRCQIDVGVGEFAKHAIRSGADSLDDMVGEFAKHAIRSGADWLVAMLTNVVWRLGGVYLVRQNYAPMW